MAGEVCLLARKQVRGEGGRGRREMREGRRWEATSEVEELCVRAVLEDREQTRDSRSNEPSLPSGNPFFTASDERQQWPREPGGSGRGGIYSAVPVTFHRDAAGMSPNGSEFSEARPSALPTESERVFLCLCASPQTQSGRLHFFLPLQP